MKNFKITKNILNEKSDVLLDYFNDIRGIGLINQDKEKELAIKAKSGDQKALDTLIKSNLRFVISCAKQYVNQGVELIDLISAGNYGLLQAARNYDPDKGYRFLTYAVWYIRREILKEIYNNGRTIRYPITFITNVSKVKKAYDKFIKENNREPSEDELLELADVSKKQYDSVNLNKNYCQSLETPIYEDATLEDVVLDDSVDIEQNFVTDAILNCINRLPERERIIIREYFGIGCVNKKIPEIAEELGLGNERVRQLKKSGLQRLEKYKNILKPLLNG